MRGGVVAAGIVLIFLGVAWFVPVLLGATLGVDGALGGLCLWLILAPAFLLIGFLVFIAGLVAKSDAELAAMRRPWVMPVPQPYYVAPQAPPPVVVVQTQPDRQAPPPPPTA